MEAVDISFYMSKAILLMLMLSLPVLITAATIGLLVGLFQGLTQIQDQTLSFAFRLLGSIAAMIFASRWIGSNMALFASEIYGLIGQLP